jgi:CDP-6-deoxy-D-xylo-4-hexulose-3-dehydrase
MKSKYNLASSSWNEEEYQAIMNISASGKFTMGPFVERFENVFAKKFNNRYAVMVNSGSSANLLMIAALFYTSDQRLQLQKGDEVIVPAVSWSTTYFPLQQYGLKVKFVDIDKETLNFDFRALEEAVSERTRAILSVNLLGNSNDFNAIQKLIEDKEIIHILDNCESMGSRFENRYTGEYVLMSTYSTFFSHHISTMEGGVILTDSEELYHILLSLRAHGWTRNLPKSNLVTGEKSDNTFNESFKFVLPGYNVRPLEMSGAIGIAQLNKLGNIISERRKNAKYFMDCFSGLEGVLVQRELGESSWFGFSIVLDQKYSSDDRDRLVKLLEENNIECRPIVAGNFVKNDVIKYFDYEVHGDLRNANLVDENGLFVGNQHYSIKEEIDSLFKIIRDFV